MKRVDAMQRRKCFYITLTLNCSMQLQQWIATEQNIKTVSVIVDGKYLIMWSVNVCGISQISEITNIVDMIYDLSVTVFCIVYFPPSP